MIEVGVLSFCIALTQLPGPQIDVMKSLKSDEWITRYLALEEVRESEFRNKDVRRMVFQLMSNDPVTSVRNAAIRVIARYEKDPKSSHMVAPCLSVPELRLSALKAMVAIDCTTGGLCEATISYFNDNDPTSRAIAGELAQTLIVSLDGDARKKMLSRLRTAFVGEKEVFVKYELAAAMLAGKVRDEVVEKFIKECAASIGAERRAMGIKLTKFFTVPNDIRYDVISSGLNDRDDLNIAMALEQVPFLGRKAVELTGPLERLLNSDVPLALLATRNLLRLDANNPKARTSLKSYLPILEKLREDEQCCGVVDELIQIADVLGLRKSKR